MSTRSAPASLPPESLWSDLDTTTLLKDSTAPPSSESPFSLLWSMAYQWLAFFRGLTLAAGSAASSAVAGAGLVLLMFLVITASFAPASDTFSRSLTLDYSQSDLVAEAVFLPEGQTSDGLLPAGTQRDTRFLAPLQPVDVWVELQVPRGSGQGLAQVVAQLTSMDGRVAAKASRAVMLRSDWWSLSSMSLAPLRWLGLVSDTRRVRVPLFTNYREKRDVPFMLARVTIKTRNLGWSAEVLSASMKVQLRLGFLRRALYTLRPRPLALLLLGCGALTALLGGGVAAAVFFGLLLYAGFGQAGGGAANDDASSSVSGDEVEVGSVSGVSEASSSMLRDLVEEGEPPSPRQHPGMPTASTPARTARAAAADDEDLWQDTLTEAGISAAASSGAASPRSVAPGFGGGQRTVRKGAAAGGPADSAMGSEQGFSAAAALRRRAGKLGL